MNILIIYSLMEKKPRKTILDSLYCYKNYAKKNRYLYLNIASSWILEHLANFRFEKVDVIIIHYSAISMRYDRVFWQKNRDNFISFVKAFPCRKIIIPQDEYNNNGDVKGFIKEAGIDTIFTCAYSEDYEKLYPRKEVGSVKIETVYTGYVDENTLKEIHKKGWDKKRTIDIGYRARKLPYWLGKHGQLKIELAEAFIERLKGVSDLSYSINNTGPLNENVLLGNDWIDFLLRCRTMLGCLGGSGLLDEDGSIAEKVNEYCAKNPEASFEEVEKEVFPGRDNYIHLYALSPRHFECAMTKTCQLLVEGDYQGVFRPGLDYIEIKRDFSNIDEVLDAVRDEKKCEQIAEECYEHVIKSGKYTYAVFVEQVLRGMPRLEKERGRSWKAIIICSISGNIGLCKFLDLLNLFDLRACKKKKRQRLWQNINGLFFRKLFALFSKHRDKKWHKYCKKKYDELMKNIKHRTG